MTVSTNFPIFLMKNYLESSQYSALVGFGKLHSGKKVMIIKRNAAWGRITFTAYDDKTTLGYVSFEYIRWYSTVNKYGSYNIKRVREGNYLYSYGPHTSRIGLVNKIYIEKIRSYTKGQGVGSILMQAVMEYSYKLGGQGRVQLDAVLNSHVFFYQLGMRVQGGNYKMMNRALLTKLQIYKLMGLTTGRVDLGAHAMYMPASGLRKMGAKIKEHPLLLSTKAQKVFKISRQRSNSLANSIPKKPTRRHSI